MLKAPKYHLGEGYYVDSEPDLTSNEEDFESDTEDGAITFEDLEILVQQEEENKKVIVKTLWDNPFLSGLEKLTKDQLLLLVACCAEELDELKNLGGYDCHDERDAKDLYWDQKCVLIECVDSEFFNKKE